jgi:hypothetical protein
LQPAVTDVNVKFDLRVPSTSIACTCPDNLPPVYSGEKLVVYGLVAMSSKPIVEGTAILKGEILGKPILHKVYFRSHSSSYSDLYPVHHLAAKALIADWQVTGKASQEIVTLSVESSVVSSHTAFIAVDEENSKPVEGALHTWDMQAIRNPFEMFNTGSAPLISARRARHRLSGKTSRRSAPKAKAKKATLKKKATKRKGANISPCFKLASKAARMQPARMQPVPVPPQDELLCMEVEDFECSKHAPGQKIIGPADILSSLIVAQQADGSWQLAPPLSNILSKTAKEVECACPVQSFGESSIVGVVWATILVLTILEKKCKDQHDEWELLAMKAEKWLKKQTLPNVNKFYTAAQSFV